MRKYFIANPLIPFASTGLIYIFYPLINGHRVLNGFFSTFTTSVLCSLFVHVIYFAVFKWMLRTRQAPVSLKALVCFAIIPGCFVLIGLFTYGVDYNGLFLSGIAIGLPNAAIPYLDRYN